MSIGFTYVDFHYGLIESPLRCICSFTMGAVQTRIVLVFSAELLALLGLEVTSHPQLMNDEVEQIRPVVGRFLASLERAWEPVSPVTIEEITIETHLEDTVYVTTPLFMVGFEVGGENLSDPRGLMTLGYSVSVPEESILAFLVPQIVQTEYLEGTLEKVHTPFGRTCASIFSDSTDGSRETVEPEFES